jgi:hypothetical protein
MRIVMSETINKHDTERSSSIVELALNIDTIEMTTKMIYKIVINRRVFIL